MKLQTKHIAPYLQYNIKAKFKYSNDKYCRKYVIGTIGAIYKNCTIVCHDTVNATPDKFKLLLRPMSDLINTIEHNGKNFIPIEEILKHNCFNIKKMSRDEINSYAESVSMFDLLNYRDAELLFEWHFDIFDLIQSGLAEPL